MIAPANGKSKDVKGIIGRIADLDAEYFAARKQRDPQQLYGAGEANRMNPVPHGINPLGTDADYHYMTSRNYFLMVERGREAVRNHPLVEQGINRLIANLRLDKITLDPDTGDVELDKALRDKWQAWTGETEAGRNECDYEGTRNFAQINRQSFFSQVVDGDVVHLPLSTGRLQTWESHHLRTPYGHAPSGLSGDGIVHGVEVRDNRIAAYWLTPYNLTFGQLVTASSQATRFPAFDEDGNKSVFWNGFRHRFFQRRGISRLSPPRDAMNGFDDLNYANIKSSLRRALISYLMEQNQAPGVQLPFASGSGGIPQTGDRYVANDVGLGLQSAVFEQMGEAAQVFKTPAGYSIKGWNANLPGDSFFEHSALLLTMLAVNLDIPLMFLLLDGSLVNFHGGRMTFDQAKLRFAELQQHQIDGVMSPAYLWKVRQWITPGTDQFDPAIAASAELGLNVFRHKFRKPGWPYVKPNEDVAAEDNAEGRNLRSHREILSSRGIDIKEFVPEVISDRGLWARSAIKEAIAIRDEFPDAEIEVSTFFRELWYGPKQMNPAQVMSANAANAPLDDAGDDADAEPPAPQPTKKKGAANDE